MEKPIHIMPSRRYTGGVVTIKSPRERDFTTLDDFLEALTAAGIDHTVYVAEFAEFKRGSTVTLSVSVEQWNAFFS